jgi:hypothetical protein
LLKKLRKGLGEILARKLGDSLEDQSVLLDDLLERRAHHEGLREGERGRLLLWRGEGWRLLRGRGEGLLLGAEGLLLGAKGRWKRELLRGGEGIERGGRLGRGAGLGYGIHIAVGNSVVVGDGKRWIIGRELNNLVLSFADDVPV